MGARELREASHGGGPVCARVRVRADLRQALSRGTGTTPLRWLLAQRILAAQRRLEDSDETVDRIARDCGFGTGATLRTHFRRSVGVSPTAYRNAFGRAQKRRNDLLEHEEGTKR